MQDVIEKENQNTSTDQIPEGFSLAGAKKTYKLQGVEHELRMHRLKGIENLLLYLKSRSICEERDLEILKGIGSSVKIAVKDLLTTGFSYISNRAYPDFGEPIADESLKYELNMKRHGKRSHSYFWLNVPPNCIEKIDFKDGEWLLADSSEKRSFLFLLNKFPDIVAKQIDIDQSFITGKAVISLATLIKCAIVDLVREYSKES